MSSWCSICKEFIYTKKEYHLCPPLWKVQIAELNGEDEWIHIFARTADRAAEKYAEEYDVVDHPLLSGGTVIVRVQVDDHIEEYECSGEAVPQYSAHRINNPPSPEKE